MAGRGGGVQHLKEGPGLLRSTVLLRLLNHLKEGHEPGSAGAPLLQDHRPFCLWQRGRQKAVDLAVCVCVRGGGGGGAGMH